MMPMPRERPAPPPRREEKTVSELFSELASEIGTLVRQEIKLATTEMGDKARLAARELGYIVSGAVLGLVALLTLFAALVFGIAEFVDLWVSALIVGAITAVVAIVVAWKGAASLRGMRITPRQTIETLREDREWIREQVR